MKKRFQSEKSERARLSETSSSPHRHSPGVLVHADDDIVVVAKSAGAWAEAGMEDEPGVPALLMQMGHVEDELQACPVYPVDFSISGLTVYARTEKAHGVLEDQLRGDEMVIRCAAIVRGHILAAQGVIEGEPPQRMRTARLNALLSSRPASPATHWTLRDSFVEFAVLECQPIPPLPGLVRCHLEQAGMPLVVDSQHGGASELMLSSFKAGYRPSQRREERPLISRPSLHVGSLTLLHPATRQAMHFEAPLPKDMRATLHQLGRFGRI